MKKIIFILLLMLIFPIYADQSELRTTKKIGIYSGGGIGNGSYLLDTSFIYNFNEYITFGVGGSSGRTKGISSGSIYPLKVQESYNYAETIGYLSLNIFPISNWPFYISGYVGQDSGRRGEFSIQTINTSGFSVEIFEINVKPKVLYGGSSGIRYYHENGFFWGFEIGSLYRDYSIDSVLKKYDVSTYGVSSSYNPSIVEYYGITRLREELNKSILQRQPEFVPFGKIYVGISI